MAELTTKNLSTELIVVGGGLAGTCAAITAAREGLGVILVQDRPVLGGNASSEVRLWALGASSHMGNNNRWAREGGVIDEILCENLYRNPEGNAVLSDMVFLDKVLAERNITLLLNTALYRCTMVDDRRIKSISAYNSQNETKYNISAALFCDCSGDGTLGYLAGADFLMGRDDLSQQEKLQYPESFGELLGSTIFFYTKKTEQAVSYIAPDFALKDIKKIKRLKRISLAAQACDYWWIEWAGLKNTIQDSEEIKMELWSIVYGIWDYIKNSGSFPEAKNYTLEWVGTIPGKRESRRFIGDYTLSQADIVGQYKHYDVVSFGGWALDHHPALGVYSEEYAPCYQWHAKGIYGIPYRSMYSKNIVNLFVGGRLISTTRAAFGSTRVMLTCAHNAQVIGAAAALCRRNKIAPKAISHDLQLLGELQQSLLRTGHYIPQIAALDRSFNKALVAQLSCSSTLQSLNLKNNGGYKQLDCNTALLMPMKRGKVPSFELYLQAESSTILQLDLCISARRENYIPEELLCTLKLSLSRGKKTYPVDFCTELAKDSYVFIVLRHNSLVSVARSEQLVTGIITLYQASNDKVSRQAKQEAPANIGVDSFEFWIPQRRPEAQNIAVNFLEPLLIFSAENLLNGFHRPYISSNAWLADWQDKAPYIKLVWDKPQQLSTILLFFDTDFDFSMESTQYHHPERIMPFCVTAYSIYNEETGMQLCRVENNHYSNNKIKIATETKALKIQFEQAASSKVPIAVFGIQCH